MRRTKAAVPELQDPGALPLPPAHVSQFTFLFSLAPFSAPPDSPRFLDPLFLYPSDLASALLPPTAVWETEQTQTELSLKKEKK